jgi:transposase
VAGLEEMSRDELIVVVRRQAGQITAQAGQISELMEANEALTGRLAKLEHLLSRNSGNSSNPPSRDDDPGKPAPPEKHCGGWDRSGRGVSSPGHRARIWPGPMTQMSGVTGSLKVVVTVVLIWAPRGTSVWCYQRHEIPRVAVTVTQYDQHRVVCGCGQLHTAERPDGARSGPVGYGPLCRYRHNGPYADISVPGFTWGGCPYACRGSGRYSPAPEQARCGYTRGSQVKPGVAVAMTT